MQVGAGLAAWIMVIPVLNFLLRCPFRHRTFFNWAPLRARREVRGQRSDDGHGVAMESRPAPAGAGRGRARFTPDWGGNPVGVYNTSQGSLSAGAVIQLLPTVLVDFLLQRHIARGLALGAVK